MSENTNGNGNGHDYDAGLDLGGGVGDIGSLVVKPLVGDFPGTISRFRFQRSTKGDARLWAIVSATVVGGDNEGRQVDGWYTLTNEDGTRNNQGRESFGKFLMAYGVPNEVMASPSQDSIKVYVEGQPCRIVAKEGKKAREDGTVPVFVNLYPAAADAPAPKLKAAALLS